MLMRPLLAASVAGAALAVPASATAPPVGPLPPGPIATIQVEKGQLFAIALPKPSNGNVWRGARTSDTKVVRPLHDGEIYGDIVLTFKAVGKGKTSLVYALTKGETEKALAARTFKVTVK